MNFVLKRPIAIINKLKSLNYVIFNKNSSKLITFVHKPIRLNSTSADLALLNKLVQENKTKNILVYSCKSTGSIRVNVLGLFGFLLLINASYFSWLTFGTFKRQNTRDNESGFFGTILNILASDYFRYSVCITIGVVGFVMFLVSLATTSRSVNKLYLLKGGKSLGIITDGIFGKNITYVLNLEETSFNQTRLMPNRREPQIWFKNKNHFFYFLLNNIEGEFHEKFLFDRLICAKRLD